MSAPASTSAPATTLSTTSIATSVTHTTADPVLQASALIDASAVPLVLWCSHEQVVESTQDDPLFKTGHPRIALGIALLAALVLISLSGFGIWAWQQVGFALHSAPVFLAFGALGVVVSAMLGFIAAGVANPSLLTRNVADLLLSEAAQRHSGGVEIDLTRAHQIMRRLQHLGQSSVTTIGLASGAVACMVAGLTMAWLQWPGIAAILASPTLVGISVASLMIGMIFASLLGLAAMVAGSVNEVRVRMAVALARLRSAQNHTALLAA